MGRKGNSGYTNPDFRFGNESTGYSGSLGLTQHYLERLDDDLPPGLGPASGYVVWSRSTQGVTLDGSNNVSQWDDISGNGINFVQTTENDRPGFTATNSQLNNLPSINTGNDQSLFGVDNSLLDVNDEGGFCLYLAVKTVNIPSTYNFLVARYQTTSWNNGWGIYYYDGDYRFYVNAWNNSSKRVELSNTFVYNAPYIFKFLYNDDNKGDGSGIVANIIGNSNSRSGTQGSMTDEVSDSGITRGIFLNSALYSGGTWDGNWEIGEILFYNSPLDSAGQLKTEKYLKIRYGIT